MNAIPCNRPKVTYDGGTHHCQVPSCGWTFRSVKSAQEPTWHRAEHRRAVPEARVFGPDVNFGYRASCECGWKPDPGCLTRTDNEASLAYHLSHDHGLVTCP